MDNPMSAFELPGLRSVLDLDGSSLVIRCKFLCGNVVQVSR